MKREIPLIVILLGAIFYTLLFFKKDLGLNLILFNAFIWGVFLGFKQIDFKNKVQLMMLGAHVVSSVGVLITGTAMSLFFNYSCLILLSASIQLPKNKLILILILGKIMNLKYCIDDFSNRLTSKKPKKKGFSKGLRIVKISIIPIIIIGLFIAIYSSANPWFNDYTSVIFSKIGDVFAAIFMDINLGGLLTFIFGFIFITWLLLGKMTDDVLESETTYNDDLQRKRKKFLGKTNALKMELRSAVVLFAGLNAILLFVNYLDIVNVWFGFSWDGQFLKQFVHEGTYLLIFSILISIGLVLFYFRRNLNFISTNKWLKRLAYAWMAQNFILVISVAIRNFHYISYFNLAYKRIAVIFFLIAVLIGIVSVIVKIYNRKSAYFLVKLNTFSVFFVFLFMSLFNWDAVIAKHNFKHADSSFIHYNYLDGLDNSALPYVNKNTIDLAKIDEMQREKFEFADEARYITSEVFDLNVTKRINDFTSEYPNRHWLSWNYSDYKAYHKLVD